MDDKNKGRILIVDDQPSNLKILFSFLQDKDFELRILQGGEQAVRMLRQLKPDIILLDVMMPGINGFETCRLIKSDKETADIPVIFMTALDSLEDKVTGFEVGGVDYITKPFQQAEVLSRVNIHLTLRRQKVELERALEEVKQLSGILPICSYCKKIRNDDGDWEEVDAYIYSNSQADISHSVCPDCIRKHYPDIEVPDERASRE
ncbi:MAG: response regulator [Candidatus Electrothrix sp. AR4]|nr:response regulator [Candidatus Electrothrix sp. AR4]